MSDFMIRGLLFSSWSQENNYPRDQVHNAHIFSEIGFKNKY